MRVCFDGGRAGFDSVREWVVLSPGAAIDAVDAVQFSLVGLLQEYRNTPHLEMFEEPIKLSDVEDALLYLSKVGAVSLQGGFLVSYNGMEIQRLNLDNKIRYKAEDYRQLNDFYKQKIQQIHIVGEYQRLFPVGL